MTCLQLALAALAISCSTLASAHHGNSAFDRNASVTVTGVVTNWQFINPHAGIWLAVENPDGSVTEWIGEFQGTLDLYRHFSFNKQTFEIGDRITLTGFPSRSGDPIMGARVVVFPDGREVDVRSAPD